MPNQRKKGKKLAGVYLNEKETEIFEEISRRQGIAKGDVLKRAIMDLAKQLGVTNEETSKA